MSVVHFDTVVGQDGFENFPGLPHAFFVAQAEADNVNCFKLLLNKFGAVFQLRKKCGAMLFHEGCGLLYRRWFGIGDCTQVVEVAGLCVISAMPHLLGNDFRTCLNFDFPVGIGDDVEGTAGERGSHNNVDLPIRQI